MFVAVHQKRCCGWLDEFLQSTCTYELVPHELINSFLSRPQACCMLISTGCCAPDFTKAYWDEQTKRHLRWRGVRQSVLRGALWRRWCHVGTDVATRECRSRLTVRGAKLVAAAL